jgi:O-antigen ligase
MDGMRRTMIAAIVLLTPVLHLTQIGGADVNLCAGDAMVALATLWMAWRFFEDGIRAPLLPLFCAAVAVTVLSIVVNAEITFFARSPLGAAVTVLKSVFPWMYFFVAATLTRSQRDLLLLVKCWVLGSAALAASGIAGSLFYQATGVENRFALAYRAHGTMGDANFFSMHLGVSFFLALCYRRLAGGSRWWVAPVMALDALGMFFSASRSGLLGFACGLALWAILGAPLRWKVAAAAATAALAMTLALAPVSRWLSANPVAARLATTTLDVEATDRGKLWAFAFGNFVRAPVAGVGYENIPYVNRTIPGRPTETHNTYLNMLSETGLLGLLVYLAVLLYYPLALLRTWRSCRSTGAVWLLAAFANIGAVGMAVNVENYRGLWILMAAAHAFGVLRAGQPLAPAGEVAHA